MSVKAFEKQGYSSRMQGSTDPRPFESKDERKASIIEMSLQDELHFVYAPKSRIYAQFALTNKTKRRLLFRIDSSAPEHYTIFQDKFILNPSENKSVKIYMKASGFTYQARLRDKFTMKALYFNETDQSNFQEVRLKKNFHALKNSIKRKFPVKDTHEEFFERQFKNRTEFPFICSVNVKVVDKLLENSTNSGYEQRLTPKHEVSADNSEDYEQFKKKIDKVSWQETLSPNTFNRGKKRAVELQSTTPNDRVGFNEDSEFEFYSNYEFQKSTPKIGNAKKLANRVTDSYQGADSLNKNSMKSNLGFTSESSWKYGDLNKNSKHKPQFDNTGNSLDELELLNKLTTSPLLISKNEKRDKGKLLDSQNESQTARIVMDETITLKPEGKAARNKQIIDPGKRSSYTRNDAGNERSNLDVSKEKYLISTSASYRLREDKKQYSPLQSSHIASPLNRSLTPSKRIFEPINQNLVNDMKFEWREIQEKLLEPRSGLNSQTLSRRGSDVEMKKSSFNAVDFYTHQTELGLQKKSVERSSINDFPKKNSITSYKEFGIPEANPAEYKPFNLSNHPNTMESSFYSVKDGYQVSGTRGSINEKIDIASELRISGEGNVTEKEEKRNKKMIFEPLKVPYKEELEELMRKEKENQKKIEALKIENKETEKQLQKISFLKEFERSEQERLLRLKSSIRFHFWQIMFVSIIFFLCGFFKEEIYIYIIEKYKIKTTFN